MVVLTTEQMAEFAAAARAADADSATSVSAAARRAVVEKLAEWYRLTQQGPAAAAGTLGVGHPDARGKIRASGNFQRTYRLAQYWAKAEGADLPPAVREELETALRSPMNTLPATLRGVAEVLTAAGVLNPRRGGRPPATPAERAEGWTRRMVAIIRRAEKVGLKGGTMAVPPFNAAELVVAGLRGRRRAVVFTPTAEEPASVENADAA